MSLNNWELFTAFICYCGSWFKSMARKPLPPDFWISPCSTFKEQETVMLTNVLYGQGLKWETTALKFCHGTNLFISNSYQRAVGGCLMVFKTWNACYAAGVAQLLCGADAAILQLAFQVEQCFDYRFLHSCLSCRKGKHSFQLVKVCLLHYTSPLLMRLV